MIHSVYSNKDAFLRELISNASDALDKLRLEAFRNKDLDVDTSDLHIEIDVDKAARTLTVRDNGIGMSRDEVVDLIGTLARSGTAELRQQLRETRNAEASEELIGQFGIGFYSVFMVADESRCSRTRPVRVRPSGGNPVATGPTPSKPSTQASKLGRERRSPCTSSPRHRRRAARLHRGVDCSGSGQEVLRLHRLADPHAGRAPGAVGRRWWR